MFTELRSLGGNVAHSECVNSGTLVLYTAQRTESQFRVSCACVSSEYAVGASNELRRPTVMDEILLLARWQMAHKFTGGG